MRARCLQQIAGQQSITVKQPTQAVAQQIGLVKQKSQKSPAATARLSLGLAHHKQALEQWVGRKSLVHQRHERSFIAPLQVPAGTQGGIHAQPSTGLP